MTSKRQLNTTHQSVVAIVKGVATEKTRRAYLVTPYKDKTEYVYVQFSDPRLGSRGTVTRARISPGAFGLGTVTPNLDAGAPVTVVIRRGLVSVVGY